VASRASSTAARENAQESAYCSGHNQSWREPASQKPRLARAALGTAPSSARRSDRCVD